MTSNLKQKLSHWRLVAISLSLLRVLMGDFNLEADSEEAFESPNSPQRPVARGPRSHAAIRYHRRGSVAIRRARIGLPKT